MLMGVFIVYIYYGDKVIENIIDESDKVDYEVLYPFTFSPDEAMNKIANVAQEIPNRTKEFLRNFLTTSISEKKEITLKYVYKGKEGNIKHIVDGYINDHFREKPKFSANWWMLPFGLQKEYFLLDPQRKDYVMERLNDVSKQKNLDSLVETIKDVTPKKEDQARIAISLVQHIPYDWEAFKNGDIHAKYPYEVLYTLSGVCGEKSELIIYLLRRLGFGTAYIIFPKENHAVAGIKCPKEYDFEDSGYCFVESTDPSIITDSKKSYKEVGKLSYSETIIVEDGDSFDSVGEEADDTNEWYKITNKMKEIMDCCGEINNGKVSFKNDKVSKKYKILYDKIQSLNKKYNLGNKKGLKPEQRIISRSKSQS